MIIEGCLSLYTVCGHKLSFYHAERNGVKRSIWSDSSLRYRSVQNDKLASGRSITLAHSTSNQLTLNCCQS